MKKTLLTLMLFVFTFSNAQLVSTVAGSGNQQTADGTGITASFNRPNGIVKDSNGNLFVAEENGNVIRKIAPNGVVTTFAGNGTNGFLDATGTAAIFANLGALAIDNQNNIYVGDFGNSRIRKITPSGVVTTLAILDTPYGICIDPAGTNLYVVGQSRRVQKVEIATGQITLIAGNGSQGNTDGIGTNASFNFPFGVVVDPTNTYLYVSDLFNNNIRRLTLATAQVSQFAGSTNSNFADGTGSAASFYGPIGMQCDSSGNIYLSDHFNNRIRKITPNAVVTTIAGSGAAGSTNGPALIAEFSTPLGVFLDNNGDLFVTEYDGNKVRKVSSVALNSSEFQTNNLKFNLYPNPASDILNIETENDLKSVEIYSIQGQKVLSAGSKEINISNLTSGLYLVQVTDIDDIIATQKLIIK
jgi:DNA-binding beta-propeller fold protein YncE